MKAAQLKALLSQVPDDAEVFIHDADTDWAMPAFEVRQHYKDGRIALAGLYNVDANCNELVDGRSYRALQ